MPRYRTVLQRFVRSLLPLAVLAVTCGAATGTPPDFSRDIRPILSDKCFTCHGQDSGSRKAKLRLDEREAALHGGKSGVPAFVPGKPEESELILRVAAHDEDERMPPPEKDPLKPDEVEKLRQWIAHGAKYEPHWAFIPPQRPPLPANASGNAIDTFVRARRAAAGLKESPQAAPETLCRRLWLDLTGLPPSPQELDEFLAAFARDGDGAYGALVERLLASPRYGEKWARHWLDVARYADSDGYEKDRPRQQWAWRDWVIKSLNADMPYNQFIIEQVAGDLLPRATQDQKVATGFLRNAMESEEGAIIAEQYRMEAMFDRMDCLGKAVLSLTLQCAQCHTHKFDPVKHEDYYRLFAYLNDTYEATSPVYGPEKMSTIERLTREFATTESRMKTKHPDWSERLAAWEETQQASATRWDIIAPIEPLWAGGLLHPQTLPDHSVISLGHRGDDGELSFKARPRLAGVTGLRLEALTHGDLTFGGPGRHVDGRFAIAELTVEVQPPGEKEWTKVGLTHASADFESADRPISEPFRKGDDDKRRFGPSAFLIDGIGDTAWSPDRGPGRRNVTTEVVMRFKEPLSFPEGTTLRCVLHFKHMGHNESRRDSNLLGRFRVALTSAPAPLASPITTEARLALAVPREKRTPAQQAAIFGAWRASVSAFAAINAEIEKLWATYPEADTTVMHLAERAPEDTRATFMLDRGDWLQPTTKVTPGTPAFLHAMAPSNKPARLAFARWLVDRRSPTTARVAVNRVWQALFGAGLVETPEDFGVRASEPSQPEVLDWLAVEFMEKGWSQKQLIRTIVTSATYRQTSHVTSELLERDPRNRWFARGPRFRVEAEVVRDLALRTAGLLEEKVGGPSIFPPVPESVFATSFAEVKFWKPATGPERYRRSLYVFRRRTMPDPLLSSFDAPNGEIACARRERSNTPLAALASLNESVFVEAARALALRVLREGGTTDAARVAYAFRLCTARAPQPAETQEILALLKSRRARLADGWFSANDVATGDSGKLPELSPHTTPADAAVWTIVARVLLNLDETLTKN